MNEEEEIAEKLRKILTLETSIEHENGDEDEDEEEEEFEFSLQGREINSPVSAEEVFLNGQIRVTDPVFESTGSTPPVRKVFVVSSSDEDVIEGPYRVWSTEDDPPSSSAAVPEMSKKSNSTGFSRLRKMKDLLVRSNSDGKDTFVFLAGGKKEEKEKEKKKGKKAAMTAAYEALYGGGGKKEKKSYLPYKVGFFTNVNSMTKNVHPY